MLKLPAFFSNGMVLTKNAKIWGSGEPGQKVDIIWQNETHTTTCDPTGRFETIVTSKDYGGPHKLTIGDITITDVYIGRVWLCGGQSNMEGAIARARLALPQHIVPDSRIRMFQVEKGLRFDAPAIDTNGSWRTATGNMDDLFAVPYFFARQLLTTDPTPIGLICTPAGGTPIEGWLPEDIVQNFPDLYKMLEEVKTPEYVETETATAAARVQAWHTKLHEGDTGIQEGWEHESFNDSAWETRMLLDPKSLPQYGSVWLRKTIIMPPHSGAVTLKFGRLVNSVKVYVNGQQVTAVDYMYPPCTCVLPEGTLREGENTIAIRIVGDANHPYIVPGKEYALVSKDFRIDLTGEWKWRTGCKMERLEPSPWFYGRPCGVYNFMLAPVLGYSIDGIIWYQGESNTGKPDTYKELFTVFANYMREQFGEHVPIIFTQLANFIDPTDGFGLNWAELREQQRRCLEIPNTAMAVAIDCGEWNDLHPLDKKTVGERLALHARRLAYGEDIVADGPIVSHAVYKNGVLTIHFTNAAGLWAKNGYPLLDVVDENGHIYKFHANIKDETLITGICSITAKHVRFGWVDCPSVVLYNAYNLPASPFEISV